MTMVMVHYLHDQEVALDRGTDYRNAVFRRCRLTYSGGDVQLEGALFFDCEIGFVDAGERARDLQQAIFASLYAQGVRLLHLDEDGTYST